MSWTDERINTLKKMWQSGKSASEIAEKLGGVTRNAVIGKAHRLGLSGRPSPIKKVIAKKAVAAPAPVKKPVATAPVAKAVAPAKPVASKPVAAAPVAKPLPVKVPANAPGKPAEIVALAAMANMTSRKDGKLVSILELTEKICRWPVGDPKEGAFGYCGAEAYPNHPYCAEHVAIAFQAPNRKDKKPAIAKGKVDDTPELEDLEVEVEESEEEVEDDTLADDLDEDDDTPVVV